MAKNQRVLTSPLGTTSERQTDRQIFSVSEITRDIRFTLEEKFSGVWIEGEISNFKNHTSGHMYFSLKDENAQLQSVMFRTDNHKLTFELEDGMSVLCFGRISVYPVRGQYQLYVERVEPKGLGALQLAFQQLKEKLEKEGLFDAARKKAIPYLPARIGLVTSIDGAALRDMLRVLDRRFSNLHILIYPVQVQGIGAAESIAEAIRDFNQFNCVDVLIIGRGGGSLEDLWAFNEEIVARAIYESKIPVISAVGHEIDFTIADFVADLRAPTPSAAAEIVAPLKEELLLKMLDLRKRTVQATLGTLKHWRQELKVLQESYVLKNPLAVFEVTAQKVDELKKNLLRSIEILTQFKEEKFLTLIGKLESLGPLATLKRGFSISLKIPGERIITSSEAVKEGDCVKTKLSKGFFISQVKEAYGAGN